LDWFNYINKFWIRQRQAQIIDDENDDERLQCVKVDFNKE